MSELQELKWYVVHTYSGHENKVKATIEKAVKTRSMEKYIPAVIVPTEEVVEITKTGKQKTRQRKVFPSYVLLKMIMTDESWYIVRNTKGVTGFVGPGSKPVPLSEEEVLSMGIELEEQNVVNKGINFEIGQTVEISEGSFKGNVATLQSINLEEETVTVSLEVFGKETSVELNFRSIKKL
ncbi:MAG: transcription termination/antitermination protein NusG [Peptostreptococcaceae bacterium]